VQRKIKGLILGAALALAATSANAVVIQYDDNSAEEGWQIGSAYKVGVLFDNPLSSSWLTTVYLNVGVYGSNNQLQIYILDPNNNFTNIVSPFTATLTPTNGGWEAVDVSSKNIALNSSFLIGVQWDPSGSGSNVYLGYDTDNPSNNSHSYDYNIWKWPDPYWGTPPDPTGNGDYGIWMIRADVEAPLPAALPLFATGLGALGLLGWRRKRKNAAAIAA